MQLEYNDRKRLKQAIGTVHTDTHITMFFQPVLVTDVIQAETTLESFIRSLSKTVYPSSYKRRKKLVTGFYRIEPAPETGNLHTHMIIKRPDHLSQDDWELTIIKVASKNRYLCHSGKALYIQHDATGHRLDRYQVKNDINQDDRRWLPLASGMTDSVQDEFEHQKAIRLKRYQRNKDRRAHKYSCAEIKTGGLNH